MHARPARPRPRLRLLISWLGTLLLCLLTLRPAHAQAPTVEEVARQLEEAAALLDAGETGEARTLLENLTHAHLDDGQEAPLASATWLTLLDEQPTEAAESLRAAAEALRAPPTDLPADARARLEAVLARPEFQEAQPSLWERFLMWLEDWLFRNLPNLDNAEGLRQLLTWTLVIVSSLVVAWVLFSFLRGLRRSVLDSEEELTGLGDIPLHASEAQQRASEAAQAGDLREAMRLLYLAALLHLDEVGLIRFDRALTNREVLSSVAHNPSLQGLLAPVVAQFDRVWYGHAPFEQADFERVSGQIEQLRTMERTR